LVTAGLAVRELRAAVADQPSPPLDRRPNLSAEQSEAVDHLRNALAAKRHETVLLRGITGSGKTEVFLTAVEAALASGGGAIVLVPEIALTHQAVGRVRARFGDTVAVLHSGLSPRARWTEWRRLLDGRARVAVGARSAVFAPVQQLRLIVVDEEHDAAYKQEEGIRYHARDLAVVRARQVGAVCILASATPSAETYHAARDGRHTLLELTSRPTGHPLPTIEVVDLRDQPKRRRDDTAKGPVFSERLHEALANNLGLGGQTLVFLNRRGFATYLQCPGCGATAACPNCSVTLTFHRQRAALVCHHCHHSARPPAQCPECRGPALEAFGGGTERIEENLQQLFPLAAVQRLDRDVANRPAAQQRILADWQDGTTDILVGTQMVSKGHDVPGVTLVVVLLADLSLNVPDFRAAERTFQLLVQVSGRAGRGETAGHVLLQTLRPDHPSVVAAITHDYHQFITGELERRQALGYPPFARLVMVRVDGLDNHAVEQATRELAAALRTSATALGLDARTVMGPTTPPIERLNGRYRWHLLLRSADVPKLRQLARQARRAEPAMRHAKLRLVVDVDPQGL
jgi:primosomal protein N' (replication factor Y) (superfamily II helicase)